MKGIWITAMIYIGIVLVLAIIMAACIFVVKIWEHVNIPQQSLESLKGAIVERDIQQCILVADKDITWDMDDATKLPKGYYRNCTIKFYAIKKKSKKIKNNLLKKE